MAQIVISGFASAVRDVVPADAFLHGLRLLGRRAVVHVAWDEAARQAMGVVADEGEHHRVVARVRGRESTPAADRMDVVAGECDCGGPNPCGHAVALLLQARSTRGEAVSGARAAVRSGHLAASSHSRPVASPGPPAWERSLAPFAGDEAPPPEAQVALQFELTGTPGGDGTAAAIAHVGIRPVVRGRSGAWIRTGISWADLSQRYGYGRPALPEEHLRLLRELLLIAHGDSAYYYHRPSTLPLQAISRRLWAILAEAREQALPLVQAGADRPVVVHEHPAELLARVRRTNGGLQLEPGLSLNAGRDTGLPDATTFLIGRPAHGLLWRLPGRDGAVHLAPLDRPLEPERQRFLLGGPIAVPQEDEARFLHEYYPPLARRVTVVADDDSVVLPEPEPAVLELDVVRLANHQVAVSWSWSYAIGTSVRREPLFADGATRGQRRDEAREGLVLQQVGPVVSSVPALLEAGGQRLAETSTVGGLAAVDVLTRVLPALAEIPGVRASVRAGEGVDGELPDYRQAVHAPTVTFAGGTAEHDHDWFDLAVTVTVDGEAVPFARLFAALTEGEDHLILDSGVWFSLDRPELRQLATLIAEARALQDAPDGAIRLSRFQASLWEDLERVGVIADQALEWQQSVRALREAATTRTTTQPPDELRGTLRPYQVEGFSWLAALHALGLGGVLADDMGLGKTLQALALVCHARREATHPGPFLVVAPASVVSNWASEAERFAPGLKVVTIMETGRRRGDDVETSVSGADLVVTSYTLFRLEYEEYAGLPWSGLVLDEAQFVKNHQSQNYRCAKTLPAPFKLAITGTPLENNLMELWSLLSITAPGLFPHPGRFTEYYRHPIERGRDSARLDRLRRRVAPLMLRRTKEQVASDLPEKQEQVLELELNPKHRRIYQTHLQRERQRVLGLLGDFSKNRFQIFRSLTVLRQASLDPALIDEKYAGTPATKLDALMELVGDVVAEGHRTLVFSQFTRFLAAARRRLEAAGVEYCYLDGTTRNRAGVIDRFRHGGAPVFLISLKAGGFGLNLTEADYCVLLDPWWNPATEAQAVDRVHRIGQEKKVMVYRLVAKDTIEEKVMALKAAKAELFDSVLGGEAFESSSLGPAEIRELLSPS